MYQLYEVLKNRPGPATNEEKAIASGEKKLSIEELTKFLAQLTKTSDNSIASAFMKQAEKLRVSDLQIAGIAGADVLLGSLEPERVQQTFGRIHCCTRSAL